MYFFLYILIAALGIGLGMYLAPKGGTFLNTQSLTKNKRKRQILTLFIDQEEITNNDVESLLKVSDATATRYLDELEKEGRIQQIGTKGRSVYYVATEPQNS